MSPSYEAKEVNVADDQGMPVPEGIRDLWFLDPDSPQWSGDASRMPDDVWVRLRVAIADEAGERAAVGDVIPIQAGASGRGRRRPTSGILFGSVAAGIALIAVGIIVQSIQSTRQIPVVAGEAVPVSAPLRGAQSGAVASSDAGDPPARRVLASGTDYQPQTLRAQVTALLERLGASDSARLSDVPITGPRTAGTEGFTATVTGIRECLIGLTNSELAQALIVDRARYIGSDAGLVIVPADVVPFGLEPGQQQPTASATTTRGDVDIWVVAPDCNRPEPGVLLHLLHHVGGK